jgi:hypothetical protein
VAILSDQEALLGSSPYFRLQPMLNKARGMPGAPKDFVSRIRDILTRWLDAIPDYARRDYFELVRFVYRRRVETFLTHMRERMAGGFTTTEPAVLGERYRAIEMAFVNGEYERESDGGSLPAPVEAASRILRERLWNDA